MLNQNRNSKLNKQVILSVTKTGVFGAAIGSIGLFLYFLLVSIIILFFNTGTDWLGDGIFFVVITPFFMTTAYFLSSQPINFALFSAGGIIAGIIGIITCMKSTKLLWLSGLISGVLASIVSKSILLKELSNFASTNLIFFYIPSLIFITTMVYASLFTHRRMNKINRICLGDLKEIE
jgi:hypothetical protein